MMTAIRMPAPAAPLDLPLDLRLADPAATEALGRGLARLLRPGDVIALYGDLGAGKTALARALIRALPGPAGAEAEEVPSPTFTLVQTYERQPAPVWHFDLYRLESTAEVEELGFFEALAEGIVLVEWPERLGSLLPTEALHVTLAFEAPVDATSGRRARLDGGSDWPARLAELQV